MPSDLGNELLQDLDIIDETELADFAEAKALLIDLVHRTITLETFDPMDSKPSLQLTKDVFDDFNRVTLLAKDVAERLDIPVNGSVIVEEQALDLYDWSTITYVQFEQLVEDIDDELALVETLQLPPEARRWLSKILAAIGVQELITHFLPTLEEVAPGLWDRILRAIRERNWRLLRRLMKILMEKITGKAFLNALGNRMGSAAAKKAIAAILSKAVPVVGWGLLIGRFIWAIAEEFIRTSKTEPV